jgi:hypothetical protein
MELWALTNRWCFIGAAPSINPGVLPKIWNYGLLQIDGALLERHHLLIQVSFLQYVGAAPSINPSVLPNFVMKLPGYQCRVLQHFADMELFIKGGNTCYNKDNYTNYQNLREISRRISPF